MDWSGFLQAPGRDPVDEDLWLRNSTVGAWDLCPGRVGYAETEGFNLTPSEAMSFGTCGHALCEYVIIHGPQAWTKPMIRDRWQATLDEEKGGPYKLKRLATEERIDASLDELLVVAYTFQDEIYPTLDLDGELLVEEKIIRPLGVLPNGRAVWFHGTPDLVLLDVGRVKDWKTAGKGWKETKVDALGAPPAYTWLVEGATGRFIPDHDYHVYNRATQEWELHEHTTDEKQIDSYLRKAWGIAKSIDAQAFPFTPWRDAYQKFQRGWHCSAKYCSAWDVCEGKAINDDVYIETPIDIKGTWA